MRRIVIFFALSFSSFFEVSAQSLSSINPKREFRGVWIATVVNIDWPSKSTLTSEQQKKEMVSILDSHKETGINAVMLQVRPAADAFYAKSREPWSKWLTGQQGKAPNELYDPLQFAIEESHKRGIELHAWFNPYRATMDNNYTKLSQKHITNLHPEWFFIYGGKKLFNPGLPPEVRDYIVKVVLDVVDNYDVDGIHMDDYFYPYQIPGQKINDATGFNQYGAGFKSISNWRRNNIDLLIKMLGDSIHKHKPYLKYGISPRGIWKNRSTDLEGSDTHGGSAYYENYADTRKWVKEGWVDYINPQVYFAFNNHAAAFEKLTDWWSNNTYNRHLYIGHAPYRITEPNSPAFKRPAELPNQIKFIRTNPRIQGSIFYSSTSLTRHNHGFTDSLKGKYYTHLALPPNMLWLDSVAPRVPMLFSSQIMEDQSILLNWQTPELADDKEAVYGYVIYRFDEDTEVDISISSNILSIKYSSETTFIDNTALPGKSYSYIITAIDRLKNESLPSGDVTVKVK